MTHIPLWMRILRWYSLHSPIIRGTYQLSTWLYHHRPIPAIDLVASLDKNLRIRLSLPIWVDYNIYCLGLYERPLVEWFMRTLTPEATMIDVGAYIGQYALLAARHVPNGHVIALEPHPESYQRLCQHVAANQVKNVTTLQQAASKQPGQASFELNDTVFCSALLPAEHASTKSIQVDVVTIDTLVHQAGLSRIDAIKIDVEGAAGQVLRGAHDTLATYHPRLIVEVSDQSAQTADDSPAAIFAFLHSLGYRLYILRWRGITSTLVSVDEATIHYANVIAL